jgi:hypothetical protein
MSKIDHACPIDGHTTLEARWLEDGQVHRAECATCDTVLYKGRSSEYSVTR